MKTLDQLINGYTELLRQGELQPAYKGILDYLGGLKSDFTCKYTEYEIGGSLYQGYMDMSYFSIITKPLKEKGLKIAVVYLHQKRAFEVWLSARNREILKKYKNVLNDKMFEGMSVFHDADNEDATVECTLTSEPDFDNKTALTKIIEEGAEKFISAITSII
jgi:hypothetical protein